MIQLFLLVFSEHSYLKFYKPIGSHVIQSLGVANENMSFRKFKLPPRYLETYKQLWNASKSKEGKDLLLEYMDITALEDKHERENSLARFFRKVRKWLAQEQKSSTFA